MWGELISAIVGLLVGLVAGFASAFLSPVQALIEVRGRRAFKVSPVDVNVEDDLSVIWAGFPEAGDSILTDTPSGEGSSRRSVGCSASRSLCRWGIGTGAVRPPGLAHGLSVRLAGRLALLADRRRDGLSCAAHVPARPRTTPLQTRGVGSPLDITNRATGRYAVTSPPAASLPSWMVGGDRGDGTERRHGAVDVTDFDAGVDTVRTREHGEGLRADHRRDEPVGERLAG